MMSFRRVVLLLCTLGIARAQNGYSRDNPTNQLGYNPFGQPITDEDQINGDEIPGVAGEDYPIYDRVPRTSFSCSNQQYPGYYADPEAQCQAFYICQRGGGRGASFLCPNGTVFNQEFLVCDWWYNFDCNRAEELYSVNEMVVRAMEEADTRLRQQQGGYNYNAPSNGQTQSGGYFNGGYEQQNNFQSATNAYRAPSVTTDNGNSYNRNVQVSSGRGGQNSISQISAFARLSEQSNFNNDNRFSGYDRSRQSIARPNTNYGTPSTGNPRASQQTSFSTNRRYNNQNRFGSTPRPVYGPPIGSFGASSPGIQYNTNENNGYRNGNRGSVDRTYLPPNAGGYNDNGFQNNNGINNRNTGYTNENTASPGRTYLPPSNNGFRNKNNGYSTDGRNGNSIPSLDRAYLPPTANFNGNDNQSFRNGLGNGASTPDRSYLPPSGVGNQPSPQYGVPGQNNNRFNGANPERSYLPPSN